MNPFAIHKTTMFVTIKKNSSLTWVTISFIEKKLNEFWLSYKKLYPTITLRYTTILLLFALSWLCKAGFSALTKNRSKKPEIPSKVDDEMRTCIAILEPRFNLTCSNKQAHLFLLCSFWEPLCYIIVFFVHDTGITRERCFNLNNGRFALSFSPLLSILTT